MNSHWQIIACDLDGTLIGWNHKINQRDIDALRRAREAHIHVAICTGRNSRECAGVIGALDAAGTLDGLGVFVNGAMVCSMNDGHAVHSTFLSDALADEAIDFFGRHGHAVLVLAEDSATRMPVYCLTDLAAPHRGTTEWLSYNRMHAPIVSDLPSHFRGRVVRIGSVVNVADGKELHAELERNFARRCATHSIYSPHYDCQVVELFHPAVNKWSGLKHLAQAMNLQPDRIITIGDDINDVAMLTGAHLSFAMANATPPALRAAKRLTGSHEQCGVAQVVESLLRGDLDPFSP